MVRDGEWLAARAEGARARVSVSAIDMAALTIDAGKFRALVREALSHDADDASLTAAVDQAGLLIASAKACAARFSPSAGEFSAWVERVRQVMSGAGFRLLPVYGLGGDRYGVLEADLAGICTPGQMSQTLVKLGAPPVNYAVIKADEIPKGRDGKAMGPPATSWSCGRQPPSPRRKRARS